jgi:uncharacterized protein (TIGR02594 family)
VCEVPGPGDNETILGWAREIGGDVARDYRADAVPWCGLFVAIVAKRAGKAIPATPLWALSWRTFGTAADVPALGDVLVFTRPGGGHVALYVGEDDSAYHVIGGNQRDAVGFTRIAKTRLRAARRPDYRQAPESVAPYRLAAAGVLSVQEA